MKWTACTGPKLSEISNEADPRTTFANGVAMGMADGSARFIPVGKFWTMPVVLSRYMLAAISPRMIDCLLMASLLIP